MIPVISFDIVFEFLVPENRVCFRCCSVATRWMPMPETAMYEYNSIIFRQDDVRSAWQILSVESKTKTHPVKQRANVDFRLCILAIDTAHVPAAFFDREFINHVLV